MTELSIIIPAFNEETVIANTLKKVINYCEQNNIDFEIIVINDGSTDNTTSIINTFDNKNVKLLNNTNNKGKGYSVRKGVLRSKKQNILFMDADNSTDISEITKLQNYLNTHDIIIGSRKIDGGKVNIAQPQWKIKLGQWGNKLIQKTLNLPLEDTQCGFKLFNKNHKRIFKIMQIDRWGFDFEMLFIAKNLGLKIKECGIIWNNNFDSKVKPTDYLKTICEIGKIKLNYWRGKYKL